MAYATDAQVQGAISKFTVGSGTTPTTTQMEDMIAGIAGEINTHLSSVGYTVPVTTPDYFVTYLGEVNVWGAAASVLKSMFPGASGPDETPAYAFYEKRYQMALNSIDSREILPASAVMGNVTLASSYLTDNPTNPGPTGEDGFLGVGYGSEAQPVFGMQKVF